MLLNVIKEGELVKDSTQLQKGKQKEIICYTYDEVIKVFEWIGDNEDLSIVNVFGPPPPDKRINGEWVWKKQPPIMGWKMIVKRKK